MRRLPLVVIAGVIDFASGLVHTEPLLPLVKISRVTRRTAAPPTRN
jgi:hypothetical protein